ncbi:MAG TPA: prepilin-type N-terminal cleavage/methylation domain-containing protein [Terriglobales bacterium]|nr:prepilin-type N-terminal cleavage/methylation domain-containing protein [Terriglobales bacterium]
MLRRRKRSSRSESGMTMIELMIAMTVLAIGLGGVMILISGAIASNNRNKMDTTATTLAEMVMERIAAAGPDANTTFTITDCTAPTPVALTVDPRGSTTGLGAAVDSQGNIDFSGTAPAGYSINYMSCGAGGTQSRYNIRWRVQTISGSGNVVYSKLVTVSARQVGAASTARERLKFFAIPATLRTVVTK